MRTFTVLALLAWGLPSNSAPIGKPPSTANRKSQSLTELHIDSSALKRDVDNRNAAAWSNFVKVYAVDDVEAASVKRDVENWNAAAWSNFVKVYAVDDGGRLPII